MIYFFCVSYLHSNQFRSRHELIARFGSAANRFDPIVSAVAFSELSAKRLIHLSALFLNIFEEVFRSFDSFTGCFVFGRSSRNDTTVDLQKLLGLGIFACPDGFESAPAPFGNHHSTAKRAGASFTGVVPQMTVRSSATKLSECTGTTSL